MKRFVEGVDRSQDQKRSQSDNAVLGFFSAVQAIPASGANRRRNIYRRR